MKHLLLLGLLVFTANLRSQSYLNKIYPTFGGAPAPAILVDDTTYVVASTYILGLKTINFGRFDFTGKSIFTKSFTLSSNSYTGTCSKCLQQKNGKYYYGQTNFVGSDSLYVKFWKLDRNLDTLLTKNHIKFNGRQPRLYDLEFESDSTFLVSGYVSSINSNIGKYDLWVAKFDTAFNKIWEKRIEDNFPNLHYGYYGGHLTIDNYGSVLVSGQAFSYYAAVDTNFYSMAARFDRRTGNLIWKKDFFSPVGSADFATIDAGDGKYHFAKQQYLHIVPRTFGYTDSTQLQFGVLDTLGNILWDTLIGPKYGQFWFKDFQKTIDGNYYVSGEYYRPYKSFSAGFKFSPKGDSIWFRPYLYQDSADAHFIWSFQETSDSGFIHFGLYGDLDFDLDSLRLQYSWMLKTDKYGCQVPGCHTIGLKEYQPKSYQISVFPNPSDGSFIVDIPEHQFEEALTIDIYSTGGQLVHRVVPQRGQTTVELNGKPPGLYLLKITKGYSEVYNQKIIIQ